MRQVETRWLGSLRRGRWALMARPRRFGIICGGGDYYHVWRIS